MSIIIRKAQRADMPEIMKLIKAIAQYEKMSDEVIATHESTENAMFNEDITKCLLAIEDNVIVGYALYFYNYSTFIGTKGLYLEDLFLYPKHRKKGYGKLLMSELFKIAKKENCGRMEWCCLNWNSESQEFYKAIGAKEMTEWTTWRLTRQDILNLSE